MVYNFQLYSGVFFLISVVALGLAAVIWMRRPSSGAALFSIFMFMWAVWAWFYGFETGALDNSAKIFWAKMEYLGVVGSGVLWLFFVLDYVGSRWWKRPEHFIPLFIIPILSLAIVWTNELHGLVWSNIYPAQGSFGPILVFEHGFWFWIQIFYQYILYLTGMFILGRAGIRKFGNYRLQLSALLIGIIIPFIGSLLYAFNVFPGVGLDLIPFYFILTGLIYTITIFPFRFLDVIPVARDTLVDELPDGVLVLDKNGSLADINPAAERMLGLEKGVSSGKKFAIICPSLDIIRSGIGIEGRTEINSPSFGGYLDISLLPLRDTNNTINGQLMVLRDITEQRSMERTLRESEVRYEALVEQSNDGVLIVQDGIYKYINRAMSDMSGYSAEEMIGKNIPFAISEEDQELVKERYIRRAEGKDVPGYYEIKVQCKNGEYKNVEISIGNIIYEGRRASMITVRDITDRKTTQRKLEMLYKQEVKLRSGLQEETNKRSKYLQALVHELRTPLTSILASGELLEFEIHERNQSEIVHRVRQASLTLEQRISELIELARGETGMLKINPLPLDLIRLINEVVADVISEASKKGLTIKIEISNPIPQVSGDKGRLRYVITNLLGNAIKFTSKGEIIIKAGIYSSKLILVQVLDTGRGIAREEMENLFDPYLTKLSSNRGPDASGLGLALSKIIVDLHQGKMWAESVPEKGSIFSFTIPVDVNENSALSKKPDR
jgi:PAS domain S-box-containing protein